MTRAAVFLGLVMSWACTSGRQATEPAPAPSPADPAPVQPEETKAAPQRRSDAPRSFEAKLEIDDEVGAKRFQGVWLVAAPDRRMVIDYRARPWWKPFDGQRVRVTGRSRTPGPHEQAIQAPHFDVHTLELLDPKSFPDADLVAVGPEVELSGQFTTMTFGKGTKLQGEVWTVFAADDGTQYMLADRPDDPPLQRPVVVSGRTVELSPFVARPGGPWLWISDVEAARQRP